jgi:hypothetical protein
MVSPLVSCILSQYSCSCLGSQRFQACNMQAVRGRRVGLLLADDVAKPRAPVSCGAMADCTFPPQFTC